MIYDLRKGLVWGGKSRSAFYKPLKYHAPCQIWNGIDHDYRQLLTNFTLLDDQNHNVMLLIHHKYFNRC